MAQKSDIPTSVLVNDGIEMRTGVLSLLQKKGKKKGFMKSNDYELNPLYWRLLSYAGQIYLLGYSKQVQGAKETKKLLVEGCSTEMNLPEKAVVSAHSNETFLCVQCGKKIIFLKAESRSQRNKWADAIRRACTREPVYHSSTAGFFDVLQEDDRVPRSVHNTADTAPHPVADFRRAHTSPAGQFQISSNRPSVSSIPSSAHSLEQQRRRSQEMGNAMLPQSQPSTISSLNPSDRMLDSLSTTGLSYQGIFEDGAQYNWPEYNPGNDFPRLRSLSLSASVTVSSPNVQVQDSAQKRLYTKRSESCDRDYDSELLVFQQPESSYVENEPVYEESLYESMPEDTQQLKNPTSDHFYMPLMKDYDDQLSVSSVNNLGLENERSTNYYLYDTVAPEIPERDYRLPKDKEERTKKKSSCKKTHAPKSPKQPIEQMDSIEREEADCWEARFEREHQQPTAKEKSDNMEKKMQGKTLNSQEAEPFHDYIQHAGIARWCRHTDVTSKTADELERLRLGQSIRSTRNGLEQGSIEQRHSAESRALVSDVIRIEKHHIEVRIPSSEPYGSRDITVEAITDVPPDLVLSEGEVLISVGLKMSPSDLHFNNPIKVTMNHSAIFSNPGKARIVLYTRRNSTENFSVIPSTTTGVPRCVVRDRDLDLHIDHFSEWWIVAYIRWYFIGKRVICTPYTPISITRNAKYVLYLSIADDNNGNPKDITGYKIAFPQTQFYMKWRYGGLIVTYYKDGLAMKAKTISEETFHYLTDQTESFDLDTKGTAGDGVFIKYTLKQSIEKEIYFKINIEDPQDRCHVIRVFEENQPVTIGRTDSDVSEPRPDKIHSSAASSSTSSVTATRCPRDEEEVSDKQILELSKLLKPDQFYDLHVALGIDYATAEGIKQRTPDSFEQYFHLLQSWKSQSRGTRVRDLKDALASAKAGGLVNRL